VFLHDVARCLALVQQGQIQLDGQGFVEANSLQRLAAVVSLPISCAEPCSEAQTPALSFLVGLLGAAGFVASVGATLRLAEAGHQWLGAPPTFQVHQLRDAWWLSPEANTRWLPAGRHDRTRHGRCHRVVLEAATWIRGLPTSTWTRAAVFDEHVASLGLLSAAGSARNLPRVRRATRRRLLALARFLLRTPFACLGLVDTRREGDQLWLRPTVHGIPWLGAALERSQLVAHPPDGTAIEFAVSAEIPPFPPPEVPSFTVALDGDRQEPYLTITIRPHAPALCTFEVAHLAHLHERDTPSNGAPVRYRLTRRSLSQALTWGYSLSDAPFLLDRFSDERLPPDAADQIRVWGAEMAVITWQAGFRLTTATPGVLDGLCRRDAFRHRTARLASAQDAWVSRTEAPALWTYLRRIGYELRLPGDLNDWPLQPRIREPLPLAPLLAILRTYGELRRLVPGLSVLRSGELEEALVASLPEDERAGVQRLVESHVVLMKHCLKRRPPPVDVGGGEAQEAESPSEDAGAGTSLDDLAARLQVAIDAGAELGLSYADTQGKVTERRIRPIHLEVRWGRRYLLAHCQLRDEERHFRLDRIIEVTGSA
jgi:hypothetical protein